MAKISEDIREEIARLIENCTIKREVLFRTGSRKRKTRQLLTYLSGILALLSAGAVTTVLSTNLSETIMQWVAAIAATVSGILSLTIAVYNREEVITEMFNGAHDFLSLRTRVHMLLFDTKVPLAELNTSIRALNAEYIDLQSRYGSIFVESWFRHERMTGSPRVKIPVKMQEIERTDKSVVESLSSLQKTIEMVEEGRIRKN